MLTRIKVYFNVTTDQHDGAILLIIDNVNNLQEALQFDEALCWNCYLELVESYLKTGVVNQFTTDNAVANLSIFSTNLFELIKRTMKAKVFPSHSEPTPPPLPPYTIEELLKSLEHKTSPNVYSLTYKEMLVDYTEANNYCKKRFSPSACSGFNGNDLHARTFDFYRNGSEPIVLYTLSSPSTFASYSIVDGISELTSKYLDSKVPGKIYKYLPYLAVSGLNDKGIAVQINMVPNDISPCSGSNPGAPDLCSNMVLKLILDYLEDIDDLEDLLNQYNIYDPTKEPINCAYQWLISSPTGSRLAYFNNNKLVVANPREYSVPAIATNFVPGNITNHAQGLERYALLAAGLPNVTTVNNAITLLSQVNYSHTYDTDTAWYSEFYKIYSDGFDWNKDTDTTLERCQQILQTAHEMYEAGDPATWWTSHWFVADVYARSFTVGTKGNFSSSATFTF